MTRHAARRPRYDGPAPFTTIVDLTWRQRKIEHWIRFGRKSYEQVLDHHRSVVGFAPNTIFAFVRWPPTTTAPSSRDSTSCAQSDGRGEPFQTLPFVRPGGEILLKAESWPTVGQVLQHVDAIEALGIDPSDVDPAHWRHVHNRLRAGEAPSAYSPSRHETWLKRRRIGS